MEHLLKVALAQIAPVWLDKVATLAKIENAILEASKEEAELLVFGEALLPGYPFWVSLTDGAQFDNKIQKEIQEVNAKREAYIAEQQKEQRGELENAMVKAIKKQASKKNYTWE